MTISPDMVENGFWKKQKAGRINPPSQTFCGIISNLHVHHFFFVCKILVKACLI